MRKELMKLNEELSSKSQANVRLEKRVEELKVDKESYLLANKDKIDQLNKQLQEERQKYMDLLASTDPQNTSVLNATILCEGYEEKIR